MENWPEIDGETPIDPSFLKVKSIATRQQLLNYEFRNIVKAKIKYLGGRPSKKLAPFDYSFLLKLHKEMYCDVWEWAGQTRTNDDVSVGITWHQVVPSLMALTEDIQYWRTNKALHQAAVLVHHRSVSIHPFPNGNGRWSRMLSNILLRQEDESIVDWPIELDGTASQVRQEYIAAVKQADNGDLEPLSRLHQRYTQSYN